MGTRTRRAVAPGSKVPNSFSYPPIRVDTSAFSPRKFLDSGRDSHKEHVKPQPATRPATILRAVQCVVPQPSPHYLASLSRKVGDESKVLRKYSQSNGRSTVIRLVFGKKPDNLQQRFIQSAVYLLSYWRDYEILARILTRILQTHSNPCGSQIGIMASCNRHRWLPEV